MTIKCLSIFSALIVGLLHADAQYLQVDTFATGEDLGHVYLNMVIPSGEFHMRNMGSCGNNIVYVTSGDSVKRHRFHSKYSGDGRAISHFVLESPDAGDQTKAISSAGMKISETITRINPYTEDEDLVTEFCPDPSVSTDLFLDLGSGAARLDLSGMSLHNVSINSAFSDVTVTYSELNQIAMRELSIRAAKALIVVKHPEYARADMITIQNDMGDTKVILGRERYSSYSVYIKSGVGTCSLIIDQRLPASIILQNGFFSSVELPESYREIDKGTFTNAAGQARPDKATRIICNLDFGTLIVIEN